MPSFINYENDNTRVSAESIAMVLVPGPIEIVSGKADENDCVIIPTSTTDLSKYLVDVDYNTQYEEEGTGFHFIHTAHLIELLLSKGYDILYKYIPEGETTIEEVKDETKYLAVAESTFTENNYKRLVQSTTFYTQMTDTDGRVKYNKVSKTTTYDDCIGVYADGGSYYIMATLSETQSALSTDWDFLLDRNNYDVKFITTGVYGTVPVSLVNTVTSTSTLYYIKLADGEITKDNFDAINTINPLYIIEESSDKSKKFVAATIDDVTEDNTTSDTSPISDESTDDEGTEESIETNDDGTLKTTRGTEFYIKSTVYDTTITASSTTEEGVQGTQKYAFDFTTANEILPICGERKDCALLVDLNYYDILNGVYDYEEVVEEDSTDSYGNTKYQISSNTYYKNGIGIKGDELAMDWKTALEYEGETTSDTLTQDYITDITEGTINLGSRAYSIIPNATMGYSYNKNSYTITVPASFVYLWVYADNTSWKPLAGVQRAVVGDTFTPDLNVSKYYMDKAIITDGEGVSFNAIVDVRSYGYTLWGDRTLLKQSTDGIQATSYFSLRNLVSDISKISCNSATRYTYETNDDVTWMNFKQPIKELLDEMVSSSVLSSYKIKRKNGDRNTMVATITLYTRLPVENFVVYVNLENANVTIAEED